MRTEDRAATILDMDLSRRALILAAATASVGRSSAADRPSRLAALLAERRMVRRFQSTPVSEAKARRLLEAAHRAPSAGNTQPWAFVTVRDEATRRSLAEACLGQSFVAEAPVAIVACADERRSLAKYPGRGRLYAVVDCAFASMLLLLAVVEEGLGACFVGALDEARVSKILGLPSRVRPIAVIPVGFPAEDPAPRASRPFGEIHHRERWSGS